MQRRNEYRSGFISSIRPAVMLFIRIALEKQALR